MQPRLSQQQLLESVLEAVEESGWQAIIFETEKPFLIRIFNEEIDKSFSLRIYIWNVTHGGGVARAEDELRIQITPSPITISGDERTILLGWHAGYQVFVGFDTNRHVNQASASPSIQIKEQALVEAHRHSFATYDKDNGEIAIAFQPVFFVDYALNATTLHATGTMPNEVELLDQIDSVSEDRIAEVASTKERKEVITQIKKKYRDSRFRAKVLSAYDRTCAMCGLQLRLVEASHILPVAAPQSPDSTTNGVALCVLHHKAYDRNLVSFDDSYRIEVSEKRVNELTRDNFISGLIEFRANLKPVISLPADQRDYPNPELINKSREYRGWALN